MYPKELEILCRELKKINSRVVITIETNGTGFGDFTKHIDLVSISPKLSTSVPFNTEYEKMHEKSRLNIDVFKKFIFFWAASGLNWNNLVKKLLFLKKRNFIIFLAAINEDEE